MDNRHHYRGRGNRRPFEDRRPDRRRPYFEDRWPAAHRIGHHRIEEPRFEDRRVDNRRFHDRRFDDRRFDDRRFNDREFTDRRSEDRGFNDHGFRGRSIDNRRPSLPIRLSPRHAENAKSSVTSRRDQHDPSATRSQAQHISSPTPQTTNGGSHHGLKDISNSADVNHGQENGKKSNWDTLESSMGLHEVPNHPKRAIRVESSGSEEGQIKEREGQTEENFKRFKSEEIHIKSDEGEIQSKAKENTPEAHQITCPDPNGEVQPSKRAEERNSFGAPDIEISDIPGRFVISLKFMQQQLSLCAHIQSTYPSALWVEADFSDPDMLTSLGLASRCTEIDIAISPSTVLMVTTLERLHQRPVSGSTYNSNILSTGNDFDPSAHVCVDFARIVQSYPFYRRTVLLVSQGLPEPTKGPIELSKTDKQAFWDLCDNLRTMGLHEEKVFPGSVVVLFCPGGKAELAKWIVAQMVNYGSADWLPGGFEGWTHAEG